MAYHNGNGRVFDRAHGLARRKDAFAPAQGYPASREPTEPDPPQGGGGFPELDCLRGLLSPATLAAAEQRATNIGVGAERVLVATGIVDEDRYIEALAHWQGLPNETFEHLTRQSCPLDDRQLVLAARTGLLPLHIDGALSFVLAPRSVREFLHYAASIQTYAFA
jgi:hypothetical protein